MDTWDVHNFFWLFPYSLTLGEAQVYVSGFLWEKEMFTVLLPNSQGGIIFHGTSNIYSLLKLISESKYKHFKGVVIDVCVVIDVFA